MQFYTETDIVDVDAYEEYLNKRGKIFMDANAILMYAQQQVCKASTLYRLCLRYMNLHSKNGLGFASMSASEVLYFLQSVEGIPSTCFKKKGVYGDSLDKKKVLIPLLENGSSPDFIKLYIERQESKNRSSTMSALHKRILHNEKVRGWEGELTAVPFTAKRNVNLRFNYSNENLVSLPREIRSAVKAKEGYVLVWGDFAQSDARIAYNLLLRDEDNIAYVEAFPDDIYAGFANWVREFQRNEIQGCFDRSTANNEPVNAGIYKKQLDEWKPFTGFENKAERDLYKVYVLETIYGTRHHKIAAASKFISTLGRVLDSCPKYKRFWEDVKKRATFGIPLRVRCYMGHIEYVAAFDGNRVNDTLFKCLNYPVQGGSSEIMILTVNRLLEKFYSLGYSEDDIHVYFVRHDEPIFEMRESVMKDSWIFRDFSTFQVDDWTPLALDFSFGREYLREDNDLMESYLLSEKINKNKINHYLPCPPKTEYYPLEKLLEVAVNITKSENGKTIIAVYNMNDESFVARTAMVPEDASDAEILTKFIDKHLPEIYAKGFRQIVIFNNSYYHDDMEGDIPVVRLYRPSSAVAVYRANLIGMAVVSTLDNKVIDVVEQNKPYLNTLKKCVLFGGGSDEGS